MTNRIFIVLVLVATTSVSPGVVAAQEAPDNGTNTNQTTTELASVPPETTSVPLSENEADDLSECDVRIDRHTRICDSSFEDGQSATVIHSNVTQSIEIADMGSFAQGGEVPTKTVTLQEGRNRVTLPGVKSRGRAGVTIRTDRVLYAHQIETRFTLIGGPYSYRDVQIAGASGALAVALIVVIQSIRYLTGRTAEPERIA